jgi:hypothetical protein
VKVLLDENFPLGLLRTLRANGVQADHVITLNWRGVLDSELRARVQDDDVIFLTHDTEFLSADTAPFAAVVVSRIRQARPLGERVAICQRAIQELIATPRVERLFELTDDGVLLPWKDVSE